MSGRKDGGYLNSFQLGFIHDETRDKDILPTAVVELSGVELTVYRLDKS